MEGYYEIEIFTYMAGKDIQKEIECSFHPYNSGKVVVITVKFPP